MESVQNVDCGERILRFYRIVKFTKKRIFQIPFSVKNKKVKDDRNFKFS